ncbi:sugar transferase [Cellulomonas alba]|uniref:Sugar transferase n=1 Tax=Cellulomonas alba TaxID=3053467 RepID=A0ABT7SGZ1_9CELL|nr:sugar transferase [Cellulomonas alba]MDM7855462.1 sugar transferase [Cellulomonas alba]
MTQVHHDHDTIVTSGARRPAGASWASSYASRIAVSDAVCVVFAMVVAYVVRFDPSRGTVVAGDFAPSYLSLSVGLAVAWLVALAVVRSRDRRVVGAGPGEYQRVFTATWRLFALVAIAAYMLKMQIGRGYLAIAAPLGLALLLTGRAAWRRWLRRMRDQGEFRSGIVVIGHRAKAARLIEELNHAPHSGYTVVGVCVPEGEVAPNERIHGVPVLGSMNDAAHAAVDVGAAAVAVSGSDAVTSEAVRQLGWDLEGTGIDLALTLALLDVAGPRVMLSPVNDLPLMYVDEPRFSGGRYVLKSAFDWVTALAITVVISPLLITIAVLVKATSPGPVFYRQERVGKDGRHFGMVKFRSMRRDAHSMLEAVLAAEGADSLGLFYKPKNDPRVTKVGRVLRRYSLDELPQLLNVLNGTMSLVGPRPQIDAEVALYDRRASRRLLVKPGLTGLWQVSGRSDLPPDEAIRLDVRYVENWTLFGDLLIMARTVKAMFAAEGAY